MEIIAQNISKKFSSKKVINDISFTIDESSIVTVTGENASGKSTLLKIIVGLIKTDSGIITYLSNSNPLPYNKFKKELGYASNGEMLIETLSAYEYLKFIKMVYRIPKTTFINRMNNLIENFDANVNIFSNSIKTYSTGYKKITELFSVFIHDPSFVVLDEPFNSLDYNFETKLKNYLVQLKKNGCTIVIATHNKEFIKNYSTKIISI